MKRILVFIASLTFSIFAFAESSGATQIVYSGGGNYSLVERTNLRRYDNVKYTGLLSREVRSFISRSDAPQGKAYIKGIWYDGSFYVTEQTVHSQRETNSGIHDSIASSFCICPDGSMVMGEDKGFP